MIIERLSQEHRNVEKLLAILERELEVFDRGDLPDYEVIGAIISYFEVYPEVCITIPRKTSSLPN